jgi:hypothetical protein
MTGKFALLVVNSEYTDSNFPELVSPVSDAQEFARVLKAPEIAAFDDVAILINESVANVRKVIDKFFFKKMSDDLLLCYFSGHGIRDDKGALYLAVKDTERDFLRSTAIESNFIREAMDQCFSKRQVLILDCCNSGAFAYGTKAVTDGTMGTGPAFEGNGSGRVVLTASDSTQFAWEGNQVIGKTSNSLFTYFLVKGLEGEADKNSDGKITVDELYYYAYEQVFVKTKKQTPGKWSYKEQGEIVIAYNRNVKKLPLYIQQLAESPNPRARMLAIQPLRELLNATDTELSKLARLKLERLREDDSQEVSSAAVAALSLPATNKSKNPVIVGKSDYFEGQEHFLSPRIFPAAYSDITAWVLVCMSQLAYDRFEESEEKKDLLAAKLGSGGFTLVDTFHSNETNTQAFLTTNGAYAVLTFRGQDITSKTELVTDRTAIRVPLIEERLNRGLGRAFGSIQNETERSLTNVKGLPLFITGHSLGGALAVVACQHLEKNSLIKDQLAACYTFGSPRINQGEFELDFRTPVYRVINSADVIPLIPMLAIGYIHVGDMRFLGNRDGEFWRSIPMLHRYYLFLLTLFRFFAPALSAHAIAEYRRKLEIIARTRNPLLVETKDEFQF